MIFLPPIKFFKTYEILMVVHHYINKNVKTETEAARIVKNYIFKLLLGLSISFANFLFLHHFLMRH